MSTANPPAPIKRSDSLPKLNRDKFRQHKLYRCPPTPPLEIQYEKEKAFTLDSVAVSNISQDYSRANPKLGSVIPPYNSFDDTAIRSYFENFGLDDLLKRTGIVRIIFFYNNFKWML